MRRRFTIGAVNIPPRLELTPLVDVVFNLLIFFAVTTTLISLRSGIPLDLPRAITGEKTPARILISIDRAGQFFWENSLVSREQLQQKLQETAKSRPGSWVLISADRAVAYERVVDVLDVVREIPGLEIALAVKPKK